MANNFSDAQVTISKNSLTDIVTASNKSLVIAGTMSNTTSSGTKAITFDPPYLQQYAIGISSQNLQNGDRHTITSKTLNGFTINYFNSGGSAIDRTFDYITKGF